METEAMVEGAVSALEAVGIIITDTDCYFGVEFSWRNGGRLDADSIGALPEAWQQLIEEIREADEAYWNSEDEGEE